MTIMTNYYVNRTCLFALFQSTICLNPYDSMRNKNNKTANCIKSKTKNKFSVIPTNMQCAKENILTLTTIKVELSMNKLHCACKTSPYSQGERHKNPRLCLE